MNKRKICTLTLTTLCLAPLALGLPASNQGQSAAPAAENETKPEALREVESRFVCMINNTLFDKPQIPVEVEGKTYFGCCEMCKERLASDPTSRQATDPVSGQSVDKATAVIGVLPSGAVVYFESKENLATHRAKLARL